MDSKEILKLLKAQQEQINDMARRLDNFLNGRIDDTNEVLENTNETLDFTMSEVIPQQEEQITDVAETIDTILTEILPNIMGE